MMKRIVNNGAYCVVLLCLTISCNDHKALADHSKPVTNTDSVICFVVKLDTVQKNILLPGELTSLENSQIRAKVPGFIRKINVDIGSKVSRGQVLAIIDAPEIDSRVQEQNAKVDAAKSRYLSSKDIYDRLLIASRSDGVIAGRELQQSMNQMMADSSEYSGARFAASTSKQMGKYLAIVAPYSGIITKRNVDAGSYVGNPSDASLFELQDNSKLRLHIAVPELYTGAVLAGNEGEVTTRSLPDKKFRAKLVRKSGAIDKDTRSETWELLVTNEGNDFKAGGYADVKLQLSRSKNNLVVPVSAVVTTLERKFVIRVTGTVFQWIDVRTGFNMGDKIEIFGQLAQGDTVVMRGSEELKPGTKTSVKMAK